MEIHSRCLVGRIIPVSGLGGARALAKRGARCGHPDSGNWGMMGDTDGEGVGGQFGCCRAQDFPGMAKSTRVRDAVRVHEIICQIYVGLRAPNKRLKSSEDICKYPCIQIDIDMTELPVLYVYILCSVLHVWILSHRIMNVFAFSPRLVWSTGGCFKV